jgi:hypothetical protein
MSIKKPKIGIQNLNVKHLTLIFNFCACMGKTGLPNRKEVKRQKKVNYFTGYKSPKNNSFCRFLNLRFGRMEFPG